MKEKNVKDTILRYLVDKEVPIAPRNELLENIKFEQNEIEFAILEMERDGNLAVFPPEYKGDILKYGLTQNGEILIRNSSYYKEFRKTKQSTFLKIADKAIAILGVLTGIIFGIHSCSTSSTNDSLIKMIETKDSIIVNQRKSLNRIDNFNTKIDSLKKEIDQLKKRTTTTPKANAGISSSTDTGSVDDDDSGS
ncbi:hypothetical protein [Flagellimonas amoyensis]|uniref:hypothetical protein n=1 Tax=Flagellimonas amoyensis TaxID=2169401 RepID=UPI000D357BED|nr:hypothetical protein [Allomuricauda amoyensis]